MILKSLVIFFVGLQLVPLVLMMERKVLGRFQNRYGPNRVGPFGAFTPIADIVKLLTKEDFRPRTSIGWLFTLAPILSIVAAVAALAIIPFGNVVDIAGTPVGLYGIDVIDRPALRLRARRDRLLRRDARRLVVRARSTRSSARCAPPRSSSPTRSRRAWRSSA